MKVNLNQDILGLDGKKIPGEPLIAADQLAALVLQDRGGSAETARDAYRLNAIVERIACAKGEVNLEEEEVELLQTVLDNALAAKQTSTFLVGRLYGILDGKGPGQGEDDKE